MTHHSECDGFRMHVVTAERTAHDTFVPVCNICGPLPIIGSTGSPETSLSLARDHVRVTECVGECGAWT